MLYPRGRCLRKAHPLRRSVFVGVRAHPHTPRRGPAGPWTPHFRRCPVVIRLRANRCDSVGFRWPDPSAGARFVKFVDFLACLHRPCGHDDMGERRCLKALHAFDSSGQLGYLYPRWNRRSPESCITQTSPGGSAGFRFCRCPWWHFSLPPPIGKRAMRYQRPDPPPQRR